ncbi:MAG: cobalamin biosynthesis protein CbiN [Methanomicrobiales archaeon HGW-Methanomicrobiales-4]|nr:MAG: cobalamin biosynthesis protein CbiN [Methanomicrobiales archaeon HGW-Methanomicrobiales-4]
MKRINEKTFIIIGVIIVLAIGVLEVIPASGDPGGLNSTALMVLDEKTLIGLSPEEGSNEVISTDITEGSSLFPDYSLGEQFDYQGGWSQSLYLGKSCDCSGINPDCCDENSINQAI